MARQKGTPIKGTIDGLTFYHDKVHGHLVRKAGGPTRQQIFRKKNFYLVRKYISVFGEASSFGREIRHAFSPLLVLIKNYYTSRRLLAMLQKVVKLMRMGNVMQADEALAKEFTYFEILENAPFTRLFTNIPQCLVNQNTVQLKGRLTVQPTHFGKATHVQFTTCAVVISKNLKREITKVQQTPLLQLKKSIHLDITHEMDPKKFKGLLFYGVVLQLFFEEKGDIRLLAGGPHCGFLNYKGVVG
jgi:hypothetical protein